MKDLILRGRQRSCLNCLILDTLIIKKCHLIWHEKVFRFPYPLIKDPEEEKHRLAQMKQNQVCDKKTQSTNLLIIILKS